MIFVTALALLSLVVFIYGIDWAFGYLDDPREPRRVKPTLPVIGHLIGFAQLGFDYYGVISKRTNAAIYCIAIGNFKVHVTHDSRLTHLIQKTKTLSFGPLFLVNKVHADLSNEAVELYNEALVDQLTSCSKETLAPGPYLDAQNLRMGEQALAEIAEVLQQSSIGLLKWSKHVIVQATAAGLYGGKHPFKDLDVEKALWVWDQHRAGHMLGIDIFGKGYRARAKVFQAFADYFNSMPDDVSQIVRERQRVLRGSGMDEFNIAKIQATLSDAAYPNTVPTLFWTIFEIFSRPELLDTIREEIAQKAVRKTAPSAFELDVNALKSQCFVLLSTYQETQRLRHSQVAFRMATEDTVLDGKYLLMKGCHVHMPVKPTHKSVDLWGSDSGTFNPYRFVKSSSEAAKVSPSSFMPFGQSPHICPGRWFASTEILIITSLLAMRSNLTPTSSKGWSQPALRGMEIPTLPRPKNDIRLNISQRPEWTGKWTLALGKEQSTLAFASE